MQICLFLCRNLIQADQPNFGKTSCRIFVEYRHLSVSFNNINTFRTEKKFDLLSTTGGAYVG